MTGFKQGQRVRITRGDFYQMEGEFISFGAGPFAIDGMAPSGHPAIFVDLEEVRISDQRRREKSKPEPQKKEVIKKHLPKHLIPRLHIFIHAVARTKGEGVDLVYLSSHINTIVNQIRFIDIGDEPDEEDIESIMTTKPGE